MLLKTALNFQGGFFDDKYRGHPQQKPVKRIGLYSLGLALTTKSR